METKDPFEQFKQEMRPLIFEIMTAMSSIKMRNDLKLVEEHLASILFNNMQVYRQPVVICSQQSESSFRQVKEGIYRLAVDQFSDRFKKNPEKILGFKKISERENGDHIYLLSHYCLKPKP